VGISQIYRLEGLNCFFVGLTQHGWAPAEKALMCSDILESPFSSKRIPVKKIFDPDIKDVALDYSGNHLDKLIDLVLFLDIHGVYEHDANVMVIIFTHCMCPSLFLFVLTHP
jgi:hypothetical protein